MNYLEHLLVTAMEECNEVSQRISKALRFGILNREESSIDPTTHPSSVHSPSSIHPPHPSSVPTTSEQQREQQPEQQRETSNKDTESLFTKNPTGFSDSKTNLERIAYEYTDLVAVLEEISKYIEQNQQNYPDAKLNLDRIHNGSRIKKRAKIAKINKLLQTVSLPEGRYKPEVFKTYGIPKPVGYNPGEVAIGHNSVAMGTQSVATSEGAVHGAMLNSRGGVSLVGERVQNNRGSTVKNSNDKSLLEIKDDSIINIYSEDSHLKPEPRCKPCYTNQSHTGPIDIVKINYYIKPKREKNI